MPRLTRMGLQLPAIIGVAVLLSGCVLPEQLDANIVMTGYRYDVTLTGRLAEPRTVGSLAKGQALPARHDEQMKAQEATALKLPGMTRFVYVGNGRYDFAMKVEGELTEASPFVGLPNTRAGSSQSLLSIQRQPDGTVVISSPEIPPKALEDLKDVGLETSGTIQIEVDGRVLESNADNQPLEGPLIWNRKRWEDRVFLKFDRSAAIENQSDGFTRPQGRAGRPPPEY